MAAAAVSGLLSARSSSSLGSWQALKLRRGSGATCVALASPGVDDNGSGSGQADVVLNRPLPGYTRLPQFQEHGRDSNWHSPDTWKTVLRDVAAPRPQLRIHPESDFVQDCIARIRCMFGSIGDGNISVSAYDTAWVAMVPALDGSGNSPQFPKSLTWIVQHQLPDGSWGDPDFFSTYDRVLSTLACVVALTGWGLGAHNVTKGCQFITRYIEKIGDESEQHMLIGFEIVFPPLMEQARKLGLDLPYHASICHRILLERERKLKKIALDPEALHTYPSSLLYSLEGLQDVVNWDRILHLQSHDGSFLCSPASTACALIHTGDRKCLDYLNAVLKLFDNAVPNVYPVDLFERIWIVDRVQRLGIARHFQEEIRICLDYVYKYWEPRLGIAWARGSPVKDVDDTAIGFRLLREHGYHVSSDVFLPFKRGHKFFGVAGQVGQAVTGMFSLYRASQTRFPGETVLQQAAAFTRTFLDKKLLDNDLSDKWIISKDLPGEVQYALTFPFHASLPLMETRAYLDQYGSDDIWIGKSLYKMPYVHNSTLLALAKADFNMCQNLYQQELHELVRWNEELGFDKLSFARQKVVENVFSAVATMPEPELRSVRRVWVQHGVMNTVLDDWFDLEDTPIEHLRQFQAAVDRWDPSLIDSKNEVQRVLFVGLYNNINSLAVDVHVAQGCDFSKYIIGLYQRFIKSCLVEAEWARNRVIPSWDEYMANGELSMSLECIMIPPMFLVGVELTHTALEKQEFRNLAQHVNVIGRLLNDVQGYKPGILNLQREAAEGKSNSVLIHLRDHPEKTEAEAIAYLRQTVDMRMLQLTQLVLQPSEVPHAMKMMFFHMARILQLNYSKCDGYSSVSALKEHVANILFRPVT